MKIIEEKKQIEIHIFNAFTDLLLSYEIMRSNCYDKEDCEQTFAVIKCITEKMEKIIESMED